MKAHTLPAFSSTSQLNAYFFGAVTVKHYSNIKVSNIRLDPTL